MVKVQETRRLRQTKFDFKIVVYFLSLQFDLLPQTTEYSPSLQSFDYSLIGVAQNICQVLIWRKNLEQ